MNSNRLFISYCYMPLITSSTPKMPPPTATIIGLVSRQLPQQPPLRRLTSSGAGPLRRLLATALLILKLLLFIGTLVKSYEERRRRIIDLRIRCIQWRQMQARYNAVVDMRSLCNLLHCTGIDLQFERIPEVEKQIKYEAICQDFRRQGTIKLKMLKR